MKLCASTLNQKREWEALGVALPAFDREAMCRETEKAPAWVHFGAGNIFRGFPARLQQSLLEQGLTKTGILAAESYDPEIIDRIYTPHDSLSLLVTLYPDGSTRREILASIARGLVASREAVKDFEALERAFTAPSLQMVSFTITEKGYGLRDMQGQLFPFIQQDMEAGPAHCSHIMSLVTALLYSRFQAGGFPLALVSMDNCSHNGEKLKNAVLTLGRAWAERGFVPPEFLEYLEEESRVSFPWTMIDKITPRPDSSVAAALTAEGIEDMEPLLTGKSTYIAPFVNAEAPEYLVVEDRFPNGRPPLEKAGVYCTDRDTVNRTERMKVTTCLNPLHTALAVYGCLLGYTSISEEMKNPLLKKLVERIGYTEGLPVVTDPGILSPRDFLDEVIHLRLPNPFIPDTPQRIATDTSQKMAIRFGETIKAYGERANTLVGIPLAIAGWLRYLQGVDDKGVPFSLSPDPMLSELQSAPPDSLLSNASLFGVDLQQAGLGEKIRELCEKMSQGPGAVEKTLWEFL